MGAGRGQQAMSGLGQETGGTPDERLAEAKRLLEIIGDHLEQLSPKEQGFVEDMQGRIEEYGNSAIVSGKQLFWLRDIKDGII